MPYELGLLAAIAATGLLIRIVYLRRRRRKKPDIA
jgi:hypothetical protein